jgi:hypothetical protein
MSKERMEIGLRFWSLVWYNVAERVVEIAGSVYELNEEQKKAMKKAFLRSGDYRAAVAGDESEV